MLMTGGVVGCVGGYCSSRETRMVRVGEEGQTVDVVSMGSVWLRHSSVWWSSSPQVAQG